MIIDNYLVLSGTVAPTGVTGQTVTATGATTSTNVIDLGIGRDIGKGAVLEMAIEVVTAPVGGTTVQFQLVEADDAAISVNVNVIVQTDAFPIASLPVGTQVPLHWDRVDPYLARRYIALRYQLVGAFSAGAYFAAIVRELADKQVNYASGFAVL